jgi:hypothetical protein
LIEKLGRKSNKRTEYHSNGKHGNGDIEADMVQVVGVQ